MFQAQFLKDIWANKALEKVYLIKKKEKKERKKKKKEKKRLHGKN